MKGAKPLENTLCGRATGRDGKSFKARKTIRTSYVDPTPEGENEALERAKEIRGERSQKKREERDAKLIELSNFNAPLPDRRYPIILADPPKGSFLRQTTTQFIGGPIAHSK